MTDVIQRLQDQVTTNENILGAVMLVSFTWFLILSFAMGILHAEARQQHAALEKEYRITVGNAVHTMNELVRRIATLEERLKSFEALEKIGLASQLGQEMLERTDTEVAEMEREMAVRLAGLRMKQEQTLARLKTEMAEWRAELAGIAEQ